MQMLKALCTAALAVAPLSAFAGGLSYNYVQAGYVSADIDDPNVDADGFDLRVSGLVSDVVYVHAGYGSLETDRFSILGTTGSLETDTITLGLGFRAPLAPTTDFIAEVAYVNADASGKGGFSGADEDDSGYSLSGGVRHLFTPQFEGGASVNYVDVFDEDETALALSALFHLTPQFSLGAGYSVGSDADSWTLGARFNF